MSRLTYKTPLGEFAVRGDCVHGISVYRSTRAMRVNRVLVTAGDLFAVGHRDPRSVTRDPLPQLYGGTFVARFRPDGTEVPCAVGPPNHPVRRTGGELPPQECCENDTMSW